MNDSLKFLFARIKKPNLTKKEGDEIVRIVGLE